MAQNGKPLNELFCALPTTIFEVMSKLAVQHSSVNLGQGFPDDEGAFWHRRITALVADALSQVLSR
jgi:N-succinyldiaminopimelate aminotransferase